MTTINIRQRKFCPVCKTNYPRPSGKSDKAWEDQVCCGRNCAAIYRRVDKPIRDRRVDLTPGGRRFKGYIKQEDR